MSRLWFGLLRFHVSIMYTRTPSSAIGHCKDHLLVWTERSHSGNCKYCISELSLHWLWHHLARGLRTSRYYLTRVLRRQRAIYIAVLTSSFENGCVQDGSGLSQLPSLSSSVSFHGWRPVLVSESRWFSQLSGRPSQAASVHPGWRCHTRLW